MPYDQVMHKFAHGKLHSGGKGGPVVHNNAQAVAIMLSEKRKGENGDAKYAATKDRETGHEIQRQLKK